eukprot:c16029_g1_i2 orf=185-1351(+)
MGLEAPCIPAQIALAEGQEEVEVEEDEEEEDEDEAIEVEEGGAGRNSSVKAHFHRATQEEAEAETKEEEGVKVSIKAQSYTPPTGASIGDLVMASFKSTYKESLREALHRAEFNFVLTDPRIQDNPIVYASDGFLQMTGYTAEEVLGRNCRFLQGPATSRHTVIEIRDAIREERACQVSILNYTKQGTPFWNLFHMAPVYSKEDGRVVHFVGVQTPVNLSSDHHDCLPSAMECFCISASKDASSPTILHVHNPHVDSLKHPSPLDVDEDFCEVREADKDKAKSSVNSLMNELVSQCKGVGVTETRCSTVAAGPGGGRVICSSLMLSLTQVQQSFVLANPYLPDTPIVHASEMFLRLTGYSREEVVGRNCRFLQGPDTDRKAVALVCIL